jgi:hypothetical protein
MVGTSGKLSARLRLATPIKRKPSRTLHAAARVKYSERPLIYGPNEIDARRCCAFVGHVRELDAGHAVEQFTGKM